jgi:hypothetical protein
MAEVGVTHQVRAAVRKADGIPLEDLDPDGTPLLGL